MGYISSGYKMVDCFKLGNSKQKTCVWTSRMGGNTFAVTNVELINANIMKASKNKGTNTEVIIYIKMNEKICFNKNMFLISIIFLIFIILLFDNLRKSNINNYKNIKQKKNKTVTNEIISINTDLLKNRDYNALRDPLSAPQRTLCLRSVVLYEGWQDAPN
jgi:hypothetical protein